MRFRATPRLASLFVMHLLVLVITIPVLVIDPFPASLSKDRLRGFSTRS
jgi:hypothetical protein